MNNKIILQNPRVIVVQKLYSYFMNKDQKIIYPKHRFKKFIKDVVQGTIDREELIDETISKELKNDLNIKRTEILLKIIIQAAIFEFMFQHKTPVKVIINEYLNVSKSFLSDKQKNFLNAILDKISKIVRIKNE